MTKSRQVSLPSTLIRPGEGTLLDIVPAADVQPTGSTSISIGIRLSDAPVPDRKYVADICCILKTNGHFKLLFGQQRVDSTELRSLLVIHMSNDGVKRVLESFQGMSKPTYQELVDALNFEAEDLSDCPKEPNQTVALSANLGICGISGAESCFDFFQASPFAIVAAPKAKKLALDPVVRVELRTSLLFSIVDKLKEEIAN